MPSFSGASLSICKQVETNRTTVYFIAFANVKSINRKAVKYFLVRLTGLTENDVGSIIY